MFGCAASELVPADSESSQMTIQLGVSPLRVEPSSPDTLLSFGMLISVVFIIY